MTTIELDSKGDIDYTFLQRRLKRSEERNPKLIPLEQLKVVCASPQVPVEVRNYIVMLYERQDDLNIHLYKYLKSKCSTFMHPHAYLYENGLIRNEGYTLIEIDLMTALIDIISIISNIFDRNVEAGNEKLSSCIESARDLFSGTIDTDEDLQEVVRDILSTEEPTLCAYIHKCIQLSQENNIKILDLFQLERTFKSLSAIESIVYPVAYSLNTLQYALVEKLAAFYLRGEKRFAIVDKYRFFYFVENTYVEKMLSTVVKIDGVKLNIRFRKIDEFFVEEAQYALRR